MADPSRKREQEDSSSCCPKKPRPEPPLEDFKYFSVVLLLRSLQARWNLLDADGEYLEILCEDGPERDDYLRDMHQIISKSDESAYQNPFGADDREDFSDKFDELTMAEQNSFYSVAQRCKGENRRMTNEDLNEILLQADSSMPNDSTFFVSLDPDTDETHANGTERFPFASVEQAERFIPLQDKRDGQLVLLECSSSCQKVQCCRCSTQVCKEHGDTGEASLCMDGPPVWNFSTCIDCNKISCSRHRFRECTVCSNGQGGENRLGMHDYAGQFDLCKQCGQRCRKIVDSVDDEEKLGACCKFWCCKKHINNHICGDDPSDYL